MAAEGSVVCSDADFDRLLEEESDSDKGWSVAKQTSDASVWRKKTSGESIHLLKVDPSYNNTWALECFTHY